MRRLAYQLNVECAAKYYVRSLRSPRDNAGRDKRWEEASIVAVNRHARAAINAVPRSLSFSLSISIFLSCSCNIFVFWVKRFSHHFYYLSICCSAMTLVFRQHLPGDCSWHLSQPFSGFITIDNRAIKYPVARL